MKHLLFVAAIAACHASPRAPRPPALSIEQRIAASLARWGSALERDDARALTAATDGEGQFAIAYGGTKLAASKVDGGSEAVEQTVLCFVVLALAQSMWPGVFGAPRQTWFVVVPTGSLGPALVAAGLASRAPDTANAFIPVPWRSTIGRLEEARAAHHARLREQRTWTCRLSAIDRRIAPTEPILQRAAAVSTTMVAGWLADVEALYLVRADCASGPALFAITARTDGNDQVLLAKLR